MSDISVLAHEYSTTSEFLKRLNDAITTLKRSRYNLPGSESVDEKRLSEVQQTLKDVLTHILNILGEEREPGIRSWDEYRVPRSFVEHLHESNKGKMKYFIDDLKKASERISQGISSVTERDIALLDQIADAADVETSRVFRKLWRK